MASPLPGRFGDIFFKYEVLSNRFNIKYNYSVTPKVKGFPVIQSHGDALIHADLSLRLKSDYNRSPNSPMAILQKFLGLANDSNQENRKSGYPFSFANFNWGNFVIEHIDWSFTELVDTGQPAGIDVNLKLLQVN
ncbi:MAG: hypothetical protein AAGG00_17300 [Cyanobacteria bacterium P01_H01_bin.150]